MNQKGFTNVILVLVIIVLAVVVGYFALTRKQEPVFQQTTTPPPPAATQNPTTQAPTTTADETANWKVYRDNKYGFELKYPNDYQVSSGPNGDKTIFYVAKVNLYSILFEPGPGAFYQKGIYSNLSIEPRYCYDYFIKNPQKININGIAAQRGDTGYLSWIIFPGDPANGWDAKCNGIRLEISSQDEKMTDQDRKKDKDILEKILSTFRFLK